MECLGLWFKGFGEGETVNSMHCHILLHVCGRRGGGGGKRGIGEGGAILGSIPVLTEGKSVVDS